MFKNKLSISKICFACLLSVLPLFCMNCTSTPIKSINLRKQNIIGRMKNERIVKIEDMHNFLEDCNQVSNFTSEVYFAILESGLRVVFKVSDDNDFIEKREILAYRFSKDFEIGIVPPVCVRTIEINGEIKRGFLSIYMKPDFDLLDKNIPDKIKKIEMSVKDKSAWEEMQAFNFIFGKWDVGPQNCLISDGIPINIDNESICSEQYVTWGEIPFVIGKYLENEDDNLYLRFPFSKARFCNDRIREQIKYEYGKNISQSKHKFVIYNGRYWMQFTRLDHRFWYPQSISDDLAQKLAKITYEKICDIFESEEIQVNSCDECAIRQIIDRRDMLLEHFGWNQKWEKENTRKESIKESKTSSQNRGMISGPNGVIKIIKSNDNVA